MYLHEVASQGRPSVLLTSGGRLQVDGRVLPGAALLLGGSADDWRPGSASEIDLNCLEPVLQADPTVDLLLIGTGPIRRRLSDAAALALEHAGIAHEAMSTASAVRAFNALGGDAREIALAALPGSPPTSGVPSGAVPSDVQ